LIKLSETTAIILDDYTMLKWQHFQCWVNRYPVEFYRVINKEKALDSLF